MKSINPSINKSLIAICVGIACQAAIADTASQSEATPSLGTIVVSGDDTHILDKKVGETQKTAKELSRQQAQDSRDLVRYETGVSVVENGRFGSSGYAIRGVDENRVAIQIDGLSQAETISSQGFKELFEGYGNFNNTRNNAEIETLKQVTIRKGADSLKAGSGALGGSVSFETKDARDYLIHKNYYASYKRGYNTADNQNLNTFTLAGRYKYFDALVVNTSRKGNELENFAYKSYDDRIQGKTREKADPYRRTLESTLVKLAFQPTENHRFVVSADLFKMGAKGHDFSYNLKPNTQFMTYDEQELRHTNDKIERKNFSVSYENFNVTPLWDSLKVTYSQQKITTSARTDDYCDGNDKCPSSTNPLGMKYNSDNQLVGEDGQLASYYNKPESVLPDADETVNLITAPYDGTSEKYFKWQRVDWENLPDGYTVAEGYRFCESDYSRWWGPKPQVGVTDTCEATLRKTGTTIPADSKFIINGKSYDLLAEDKGLIGSSQLVATNTSSLFSCDGINCNKDTISAFKEDGSLVEIPLSIIERDGKKYAKTEAQENNTALNSPKIIVPNKLGHQENLWTQRDLKSTTKQLNLDLTKYLEVAQTQHNLSYGGLWSETKKEMINLSGNNAINVKWWALYPLDCSQSVENVERYSALCNNSNVYSFLIPVKNKTGAIYFIDDFKINDYLGFGLGYRFDRVKYHPEYIPGVTPKIPDDMVTNLYVTDPQFDPNNFTSAENQAKREENANANIKAIAQKKKFSAGSYSANITLDPLSWLRLQAKYGKAFRAPTSDEIYFTFKHPDFSIIPNKDLNQETAKTKELALTLHNDFGYISTSVFETKYSDFIDLVYQGSKQLHGHSKLRSFNIYQNINRPNAKVTGIEIASKIMLGSVAKPLTGLSLSYKYTHQKGRMDNDIPMNAIQPKTAVYGLSYTLDDKLGLDLYVTHVSAKNGADTYNMYYKEEGKTDSTIKWRSNAYTLIDLLGYVKPIKHLTLSAGVYNLTNRKYITWDSARSIRPFGTSNLIDQESGLGLNRFTSPGRNYRLSAQLEF